MAAFCMGRDTRRHGTRCSLSALPRSEPFAWQSACLLDPRHELLLVEVVVVPGYRDSELPGCFDPLGGTGSSDVPRKKAICTYLVKHRNDRNQPSSSTP